MIYSGRGSARALVVLLVALATAPHEARAQEETSAEPSAEPAAPAPETGATPDREEAPPSRVLRIDASAGVGWTWQDAIGGDAHVALARAAITYVGIPGLGIGADVETQVYRRRYITSLPSASGSGLGRLDLDETRARAGLAVGYDIAQLVAGDRRDAGLEIALVGGLEWFSNEVLPVMVGHVGGSLSSWVDVANALRLSVGVSYEGVPSSGDAQVVQRDALGGLLAELRWFGSARIELAPRAFLGPRYFGEWLAYERSSRFVHALTLDLSIDL